MTIDTIAVNQQVNLLSLVIGQGVELRRVASTGGGEYAGSCPFCGGKDRFRVQPDHKDGGRWYCRQCGADRWHDAIDFVRRRDSAEFIDAVKTLTGDDLPVATTRSAEKPQAPPDLVQPPGAEWEGAAMFAIAECADFLLTQPDAAAVYNYLIDQRGLTHETIRTATLGYNARGRKIGDYWLEEGITIPMLSGADLWSVNVRTTRAAQKRGRPKYQAMAGSVKRGLYNVNRLEGAHTAVVCEGEFDALLLGQYLPEGWAAVATGGATIPADRWRLHFAHLDRLLLCFDNDEAGVKARDNWLDMFGWAQLLQVPEGNDITDYWKTGADLAGWVMA